MNDILSGFAASGLALYLPHLEYLYQQLLFGVFYHQ